LTVVLPAVADEPIEQKRFRRSTGTHPPSVAGRAGLPRRAATEAFLFQQFLVLIVLVPVAGAMSIAAHSIIGEKQTRSLEPVAGHTAPADRTAARKGARARPSPPW